jgi:hypothetical protein
LLRHNLSDPSDVHTVIEAFQQAYPHVKIATLEEAIQAFHRDQTIINTIAEDCWIMNWQAVTHIQPMNFISHIGSLYLQTSAAKSNIARLKSLDL